MMCVGFIGFVLMLFVVGFGAFQELREMLVELRESNLEN